MKDITTRTTSEKLHGIFATRGLPEIVVSNNGPTFVSNDLEQLMARNGIRHIKNVPYHPFSNECAEGAVQPFKPAMKKSYEKPSTRE
jgi:transposase InsO family protein